MARRCPAALCLLALFATPARALDFAPCTEPGHAAFDCATLPVPIDRDGVVPGTIDIHVERRRGQAPGLPVLVALAGGPGAAATGDFDDDGVEELGHAFDAVQLVVFDQRGTGLSGALDCGKLEPRLPPEQDDCDRLLKPRVCAFYRKQHDCDGLLGPAGAFYRTADSVLDLDAVRAALGAEQLILFGVSYGTFVAAEYARTFPERVQALVLDSPIGPDGGQALAVTTAHATARVLEALCAGGACNGITRDPVGDTAALVSRLAQEPLRGRVRLPRKKKSKKRKIKGPDLLGVLVHGDQNPALRLLYPAAAAAALRGDKAPLLRLDWLADKVGGSTDEDVRKDSEALFYATSCGDTRFPWDARTKSLLDRRSALKAAARALPKDAPFPFDAKSILGVDLATACLGWPRTTLPGAVVLGPLPDVPLLVLVGEADLRTPVENAAALTRGLPRAATLTVPQQGHSVVADRKCAQTAVARFLVDPAAPLCRLCNDVTATPLPVQPVPVSLDALPEAPGLTGLAGRTLTAVHRTLVDAMVVTAVVNGDVGGLRHGSIACPNHCPHDNRVLTLHKTSLIKGVKVSGTITLAEERWMASVTVAGRTAVAGSLEFHSDGSVTGRLGDQDVATTLSPAAEVAALRRRIPSIGARLRRGNR
jgi:pimeloyl-ACP methyl ester carboxylesterase